MKQTTHDIFSMVKSRLRNNPKFRALTPSEKWFWIDLCMFLDDQGERGVSRWPLDRIARALGAPIEVYRSLVSQEVLKGAKEAEQCSPYVHVDRRGEEHTLIPAQLGPIWYSSAIVRDEYLRQVASKSGRKGGGNPALCHTYNGASKGVVKGVVKGISGEPPPSVSPPTPPSLITPLPGEVSPDPSPPATGAVGSRRKSQRARVLSDEQVQARDAFGEWFRTDAWPARNEGVAYEFDGSRDAAAVLKILRSQFVAWDLAKAKALAMTFLDAADLYIARQGRPLWLLAQQLNHWTTQTAARGRGRSVNHGIINRKPGSQSQFIGARREVPDLAASGSGGGG